jgi:hypothetical protein
MTPDEQKREIARLDYDIYLTEAADRLKFQVEFVQAGLRSLMLINGGAIVALFTLIGNSAAATQVAVDQGKLWCAFVAFVAGLLFTLLTTFAAFFSQVFYAESTVRQAWSSQREMLGGVGDNEHVKPFRKGKCAEILGIACFSAALACFAIGAGFALAGVLPG